MSKRIVEIARHPMRFGALAALAIVVAMLALLSSSLSTDAVHNEGMLEIDGDVAYQTGTGAIPGAGNCPFIYENGAPVDCISNAASFDWADTVAAGDQGKGVCKRDTNGYITEVSSLPALPAGASIDDLICQADFYQTSTLDTSYHTGSDKDYQDISGPEPVWHCIDSSNATSKADILNAEFAVTTVPEGGVDHQVVYFGAERDTNTGTVFNGYWILQNQITVPGATTGDAGQLNCSGGVFNFSGTHTCGDVLLLFNYESGGRIGSVGAWQWINGSISDGAGGVGCDRNGDGTADATCTAGQIALADTVNLSPGPGKLCLKVIAGQGDCRSASTNDDLCGRVNGATNCTIKPASKDKTPDLNPPPCSGPGSFPSPWEPKDGTPAASVLESPTFSEVGIDLTGLNLELPCIAGLAAESRSSASPTATLKDLVSAPTGAVCGSGTRTEIHNTASDGTDIQGTAVEAGTVVHDHAFVTPSGSGGAATGTVTYTLFNNTTCTAGTGNVNVLSTQTVTISPGIPANTESTTQIPASNNYTTVSGTSISYQASVDLNAPYTDSTAACEPLQVVDAQIDLSPLTATNEVNSAHTITCTIQQNDGLPANATGGDAATGFGPAPDGTTCTLSLLNNTANAAFVSGNTCTTTSGSCTVQINTSTAGSVDIHATTTFSVGGASLTRQTDGLGNNSGDANKVYVDAQIDLSPLTDTNPINDVHTITATVLQDDGRPAGAPGDAVTGFGPAPDGTCVVFTFSQNTIGATFTGPDDGNSCGGTASNLDDCRIGIDGAIPTAGQCPIHITSSAAGTVKVHATTTFSVGGVSLTRATDGLGNNSGDAEKVFEAAAIMILKRSTKTGFGGSPQLVKNPGALFSVDGPDAGDTADFTVKDNNTPGSAGSKLDEDPTIGEVCVSGLEPGSYTVTETAPPAGYALPPVVADRTDTATAPQPSNCTDNQPGVAASAIFVDPPLFDIQVRFRDGGSTETFLVDQDPGPGVTLISCTNVSTGTSSTADTTAWDDTLTVTGIQLASPQVTIQCTLVVDP